MDREIVTNSEKVLEYLRIKNLIDDLRRTDEAFGLIGKDSQNYIDPDYIQSLNEKKRCHFCLCELNHTDSKSDNFIYLDKVTKTTAYTKLNVVAVCKKCAYKRNPPPTEEEEEEEEEEDEE
jgi:hypothetical protein